MKIFTKFFATFLCCITFFTVSAGNILQVPQLSNIKLDLDGEPSETFWKKAAAIDHIYTFRSTKMARAKTKILFCADKDNLYLALLCHEPANIQAGKSTDSVWKNDNVEIFFGQLGEYDWYRHIVFGLNGQKTYQEFAEPGDFQYKVKVAQKSWSAEVIFPRSKLACSKNDIFGFNLLRCRRGKDKELQSLSNIIWGRDVDKFRKVQIVVPDTEITHGPWTFDITDSTAGIAWECKGKSKLFLRKVGERNFRQIPVTKDRRIQYAFIKDLKHSTRYEYRIGNDRIHSFTTLSLTPSDFTFAITSDIHGRAKSIARILQHPDVKKSDIFFCLGDLVTNVVGHNVIYDGFLDSMIKNWDKPFYCVRGNHEYRGNADVFFELFAPHKRQSFGAFTHKGVYFLLLDSDGDFAWTFSYEKMQKAFLQKEVRSKEFKEAQYRILLVHKPLYSPKFGGGVNFNKMIADLPENVIKAFDLYLSGHKHSYNRLLPGAKKMHSTLPAFHNKEVDFAWPFPVLVSDVDGMIIVKKSADALHIKVVGGNSKVLDTFSVKRK